MELQLQESIENLTKIFHSKMASFEAALISTSQGDTADLTEEFTTFRSFITEALKCLQHQVELLSHSVDRIEMQGRRKILLLHSVSEKKGEDLQEVVADLVINKLNIDNFSTSDIKRCHRLGRSASPHKIRPILVKLHHISIRDKIWFTKTKLKGSGITISEFLTKARHDVFMAARDKFGISKCWTKEGRIYVSGSDGQRHHIASFSDLNMLATSSTQDSAKPSVRATRTEAAKTRRNVSAKK